MAYDLNKPAFGPGADAIGQEEAKDSTADAEESKSEGSPESSDEEQEESRVKYSRFKKFHDRALEAEREAQYWKGMAESKQNTSRQEEPKDDNVPSYWTELYGDSDASLKAWKVQEKMNQQLIENAERKAIEAFEQSRDRQDAQLSENIESIDEGFENLSDTLGRELTEKEQSSLLDIVDEFTPKDDKGNYLGQILSFDKAWEIYELKSNASKAPKKASRDAIASLTGNATSGESSTEQQERNKNFNPLAWNAWRDRV